MLSWYRKVCREAKASRAKSTKWMCVMCLRPGRRLTRRRKGSSIQRAKEREIDDPRATIGESGHARTPQQSGPDGTAEANASLECPRNRGACGAGLTLQWLLWGHRFRAP